MNMTFYFMVKALLFVNNQISGKKRKRHVAKIYLSVGKKFFRERAQSGLNKQFGMRSSSLTSTRSWQCSLQGQGHFPDTVISRSKTGCTTNSDMSGKLLKITVRFSRPKVGRIQAGLYFGKLFLGTLSLALKWSVHVGFSSCSRVLENFLIYTCNHTMSLMWQNAYEEAE